MSATKAGVLGEAFRKLRTIRCVAQAQYLLDTDIGQMAIVKHMGRKMDAHLRRAMEAFCERRLTEEGHEVTVEAAYHLDTRTVQFTAHAKMEETK